MRETMFLRIYLLAVLAFAFVGLMDNILTFLEIKHNLFGNSLSVIAFFFFFFNIIAIFIFRYHGIRRKIAYVLPIYHLVTYLIFVLISLFLIFTEIVPAWTLLTIIILSTVFSLFEMVFSTYLLVRFKLFE